MDNNKIIKETVQNVFGIETSIKTKVFDHALPIIYSGNFYFYLTKGSLNTILIVPKTDDIPFDIMISVYNYLIRNERERPIHFSFDSSEMIKKRFDSSNISYLCSDGSYRLFEKTPAIEIQNEEDVFYTKTTQLIIDFYLNNEIRDYTSREIASILGVSASSVSRSNVLLTNVGALRKVGLSTGSRYIIKSRKDLLDKTEQFWIKPYKHRVDIYLNNKDLNKLKGKFFYSGDSALSVITDLEKSTSYHEIAISKETFNNEFKAMIEQKKKEQEDDELYSFEVFINDPKHFSYQESISLFSLYIMMRYRYRNSIDPRIKEAISTIRRMIING